MAFLFGITPVFYALKSKKRKFQTLFIKDKSKSKRVQEIAELAKKEGLEIQFVDNHLLSTKSSSKIHQGVVLECSELTPLNLDDLLANTHEIQTLVALDCIEDPQNLGAIIRSASFLGASGVIVPLHNSAPLSTTVSKTSAGSLEFFPIYQVTNLAQTIEKLKKENFLILGAGISEYATPYNQIPKQEKVVLIMGNEGTGLRNLTEKKCDEMVYIPGNEEVDSLNVSAAGSILMNYYCNFKEA